MPIIIFLRSNATRRRLWQVPLSLAVEPHFLDVGEPRSFKNALSPPKAQGYNDSVLVSWRDAWSKIDDACQAVR